MSRRDTTLRLHILPVLYTQTETDPTPRRVTRTADWRWRVWTTRAGQETYAEVDAAGLRGTLAAWHLTPLLTPRLRQTFAVTLDMQP